MARARVGIAGVVLLAATAVACGRSVVVQRPGGGTYRPVALQAVHDGRTTLHALVGGEAAVRHALSLADGDRLVTLTEAIPQHVLRLSPEGAVRWARPGRAFAALERGGVLRVVGELAGEGEDALVRGLFALDARGAVLWQRSIDVVGGTDDVRVVAVGSTAVGEVAVVAGPRGVIGVDAAGRELWSRAETVRNASGVIALAVDDRVVVGSAEERTSDADPATRATCTVRALDPATGTVLAEQVLPTTGTRCILVDAASRGGPLVVWALDVHDRFELRDGARHGETRTVPTVLALDRATLAVRGTTTMPRSDGDEGPTGLPSFDGAIGEGEVVLVARYAAAPEQLALHLVDASVDPPAVRSFAWLVPERLDVGEHALDSYVQVFAVERTARGLDVAAQFVGALRGAGGARVQVPASAVERCEASGFIECTPGDETVLIAPTAGLFAHLALE